MFIVTGWYCSTGSVMKQSFPGTLSKIDFSWKTKKKRFQSKVIDFFFSFLPDLLKNVAGRVCERERGGNEH